MQKLEILVVYCVCYTYAGLEISWDNSVETDFNSIDSNLFRMQTKMGMPNWFFIFPGTKWCGPGNISENVNDLGQEIDTDKCCRTHDFCPEIINGYQTKHNLKNPNFYTRLHCDCDDEFYRCLKSANTTTSTQVGQIYFTVLGTQCYREDFPITGCKKETHFPTRKCLVYSFDESKTKIYQFFDLPNF